jgi:predicted alpha/beta-hydrolase family hydrolase
MVGRSAAVSNGVVDTPWGEVPVRYLPGRLGAGFLLAHGAGAGQGHPWMVGMADRLAGVGFPTWTFEYAYMAGGRRAPDRLPKLLDVHEAVAASIRPNVEHLVLAGKSMGGRVGGHLVAEGRADVSGLVYLGYPLVPIGKTEPRDTSHLRHVDVPQLFVSGTRDRMGPLPLIEAVVASIPDARLVTIADGDHSFTPRVSTGRTLDDALDQVVTSLVTWVDDAVDPS